MKNALLKNVLLVFTSSDRYIKGFVCRGPSTSFLFYILKEKEHKFSVVSSSYLSKSKSERMTLLPGK